MRTRALLVLTFLGAAACQKSPVFVGAEGPAFLETTGQPIRAIPDAPSNDPRILVLGEKLFGDRRLSADGKVACSSCHRLDHGGADDVAQSTGVNGRHPALNTPPVFNLAFAKSYGWFGAVESLEDEVEADLASDDRMGNDSKTVIARLAKEPEISAAFREAFPSDGLNAENLRCALADFVRSLVSPNAKIDRWIAADAKTRDTIIPWPDGGLGYVEFKSFGCASCHQGVGVGGNLLSKMSLEDALDYESDAATRDTDAGRFVVTHVMDDRHVLRVPSLRNVACTAPYFHDGSAATLEEAVAREAIRQVGHPLNKEQIGDITSFLRTLTGEYRGKPL